MLQADSRLSNLSPQIFLLTLSYNLKKTTNDGNLFSFIFFVNSIYTSD